MSDAAWRTLATDQASLEEDDPPQMVELQLDVAKAYEFVDRTTLVEQAKLCGFPMELSRVSLTFYEWPRRLSYAGLFSKPVCPYEGRCGRRRTSHM